MAVEVNCMPIISAFSDNFCLAICLPVYRMLNCLNFLENQTSYGTCQQQAQLKV
jgi:hypothetical protein